MSIVFMDGFDLYGFRDQVVTRGYQLVNGDPSGNTRFGVGQSWRTNGNSPLTFPAITALSAMTIGFAFSDESTGSSNGSRVLSFKNGGTTVGLFGYDITGAIRFARDDFGSNQFGITAPGLIAPNNWNYIEIEFTRHASAGAFNIYKNGALVLSGTGLNTGAADVNTVQFSTDVGNRYIDDFYMVDAATRLGECRIDTLRPTADTATKGFTPNSGSNNFSRVSDATFDGDTSYNSATTPGAKDLFDIGDLSVVPSAIFAVQTILAARNDNTALSQLCVDIKSGATSVRGGTKTLAPTYSFYTDTLPTDPATSAAWTASAVNALQLGYEILS